MEDTESAGTSSIYEIFPEHRDRADSGSGPHQDRWLAGQGKKRKLYVIARLPGM